MSAGARARTLSVLHAAGSSAWRGRQRQALALAESLALKGHRIAVAAPEGSPLAQRAERSGLSVVPLAVSWASRLPGWRRHEAPDAWDIVHLHDLPALRILRWNGGLAGGAVRVLSVRGDAGGGRALPRGAPSRRVDHFFAASEWVVSALTGAGIAEERISLLHTGVDLERFRPPGSETASRRLETRDRLGLAGTDFVAGTVLHLTRDCGVDDLVEAARRIRSGATPPGEERIRLLVVGDGAQRGRLEREAARRGMGDAVVLTGAREDVDRLMGAMDLYVYPRRSDDGFPVALREAMASGLPVVATDLMGIREIIDNGRHGLIAPAGDPEALALNIMRLARDEVFARQLGRSGVLKVQRYAARAMAGRAEELYFRLVRDTR